MKGRVFLIMGIFSAFLGLLGCKTINSRPENLMTKPGEKTLFDFTAKSIDGQDVNLSVYKGKKILIVNVASECGYTPQYKGLEELYEKFKDKLVILGFPANNFGAQEPGTNDEIKKFCENEYKVTFPMFSKISVIGDERNEIYKWLTTKELNGWNDKAPTWNFCKYLVDENGKLSKFYSFRVEPLSEEIVSELK
jgi:glutathione peroxidase